MSDKSNPWEILNKDIVYENAWIEVLHHKVIHPDNSEGIYGVVSFKNRAVAVIPVSEDGYTWIVGQYRFAIDQYSWEIPEGGCPAHETYAAAAKRELQEETGIIATDFTCIIEEISLSNSVTDEKGRIYIAQDLSFTDNNPDPSEEIIVKKIHLTEAIEMATNGKIHDSLSLIGLLKVKTMLEEGDLSL